MPSPRPHGACGPARDGRSRRTSPAHFAECHHLALLRSLGRSVGSRSASGPVARATVPVPPPVAQELRRWRRPARPRAAARPRPCPPLSAPGSRSTAGRRVTVPSRDRPRRRARCRRLPSAGPGSRHPGRGQPPRRAEPAARSLGHGERHLRVDRPHLRHERGRDVEQQRLELGGIRDDTSAEHGRGAGRSATVAATSPPSATPAHASVCPPAVSRRRARHPPRRWAQGSGCARAPRSATTLSSARWSAGGRGLVRLRQAYRLRRVGRPARRAAPAAARAARRSRVRSLVWRSRAALKT